MKNTLSCYYIPLILVVCVTLLTRLERSTVNTVPYHSTGAVSVEEVTQPTGEPGYNQKHLFLLQTVLQALTVCA